MRLIPYGSQAVSEADIAAVEAVLRSDFLTQGPVVPKFEAAVAQRVAAAHGVATNSATSALHIAVAALGVGPGDWLWTAPITFVASANCGVYCGAHIDFVDIEPGTFNMCPNALRAKLEATPEARRPKVIVPVHMAGQSPKMEEIAALGREHGFAIVEDASHAIGAFHGGHPVGACTHSDIAVFSFHPVKIVTSAEGGMAMTQNAELAARMARLRTHGITREPELMSEDSHGPWYYQMLELGWNYRMTEIQAALGLSQMDRLDAFVTRRRDLAARYDQLLAGLPIDLPERTVGAMSSWHLYIVRLRDEARHRAVFEQLRADGLGVNLHYIPVHLQPYYRAFGFGPGDFPASENYYKRAISIPLFPGMTDADQDRVDAALGRALA